MSLEIYIFKKDNLYSGIIKNLPLIVLNENGKFYKWIKYNTFEKNHSVYTFLINNNATELAQQNGVISQEDVIVGHSAIINPCY